VDSLVSVEIRDGGVRDSDFGMEIAQSSNERCGSGRRSIARSRDKTDVVDGGEELKVEVDMPYIRCRGLVSRFVM
jgi:hypothetical protein